MSTTRRSRCVAYQFVEKWVNFKSALTRGIVQRVTVRSGRDSKWFGLLPEEKLLDPAGIAKARLDKNDETQTVLEHFHKTVRDAVVNQNNIIDLYHERTYAAYGDGALSNPSSSAVATGGNGEGNHRSKRARRAMHY